MFTSLYDFMNRLDTHKVGKKVVESLIESGCFDFTGWSRSALLLSVDPIFEEVQRKQKDGAKGILSLFSLIEEENGERFALPPASTPASQQQVLKREYELLGIYLNGHPLDEFRGQLGRLSCVPLSEVGSLSTNAVFRAAFIIEGIVVKISAKSQRKFAILTIGDGIEHVELPVWPDLYESKSALIVENQLIYAVLQKEMQGDQVRLQCRWLSDLNQIGEPLIRECDTAYDAALTQVKKKMDKPFKTPPKTPSKTYQVHLDADKARLLDILTLKEAFRAHKGSTPVELLFLTAKGGNHSLWIDQEWGVEPHHELAALLRSLPCVKQVIDS
jgi:DNA polymerase-3 subunit alpha